MVDLEIRGMNREITEMKCVGPRAIVHQELMSGVE